MGVHRIAALLPEGGVGHEAFLRQGYALTPGVEYFEKREPLRSADLGPLGAMGGRMIDPVAWSDLDGMSATKELIERRIVLPLAEPGARRRHGVEPPKAVVLFGPPGTGKTTFAKAVAGRLGWPFVELFPSRLAAEGARGRAARCATSSTPSTTRDLVAVHRRGRRDRRRARRRPTRRGRHQRAAEGDPGLPRPRRPAAGLRHQLRARPRPGAARARALRLRAADRTARRGRPRGALAPDSSPAIGSGPVPVDEIVAVSELFTPADVEFAARKAAQAAFERALVSGTDSPAGADDVRASRGGHQADPHPRHAARVRGGHRAVRAALRRQVPPVQRPLLAGAVEVGSFASGPAGGVKSLLCNGPSWRGPLRSGKNFASGPAGGRTGSALGALQPQRHGLALE